MSWQRLVVDTALEINPETGRLAYREVVLTVPRQSGKTTLMLALAVWRSLAWRGQVVIYAAQTRNDARKKWEDDFLQILDSSVFESLYRTRKTNGNEALLWRTGSRFGITSTTEKAGHGSTVDLGFVDEAFSQTDARLEQAYKPAMITRPEPQLWVVSTAGTDASVYLNDKVARGRTAVGEDTGHGLAYFEWSADPDADPSLPETWHTCMPALGYTVTDEAVAADFSSMDIDEFRRAYCNIPTRRLRDDPAIPLASWESAETPDATIDPADVLWAIDMPPDRARVSVAVAGRRPDGRVHLEVAAQMSPKSVVAWLASRTDQVALDGRSPAGALADRLEDAGLKVDELRTGDFCDACEGLYDAVLAGSVVHIGQPELTTAVGAATWRAIGDRRALNRRDGSDVSPLVAVAIAHSRVRDREPVLATAW